MTPKTLADRIEYARELAGLTPRGLSIIAGLDPTHVRLIEDGERPDPRSSTISKLANALGLTTDWLLDGRGPEPDPEVIRSAVEAARASANTHDAAE
jgi:transcriptional regulator with XRE-family HTH domain